LEANTEDEKCKEGGSGFSIVVCLLMLIIALL
jgi:hypothetical protein